MFEETPPENQAFPEKQPEERDPVEVLSAALEKVQNRPLLQRIEKNTSVLPALLRALTIGRGTKAARVFIRDPATGKDARKGSVEAITAEVRGRKGGSKAASRQPQGKSVAVATARPAVSQPAPVAVTPDIPATPRTRPARRPPAAATPKITVTPVVVPAPAPPAAAPAPARPSATPAPARVTPAPREPRPRQTQPAEAPQAARQRQSNGRFASSGQGRQSAGQRERDRQRDEAQTKGLKGWFKAAIGAVLGKGKEKEGDLQDAAGKALGGPIWEALKEMQGAAEDLKDKLTDEKTLLGKSFKWLGKKTGVLKGPAAPPTEGAEQRRHRELIQTIEGHSVGGGGGSDSGGGVTGAVGGGIAGVLGSKLLGKLPGGAAVGKILAKAAPLLAALTGGTVLAGIAAAGSLLAAGKSLIFGGSNPINELFKKTGLPKVDVNPDRDESNRKNVANTQRVNAERVAQGKQPLKFDPVTGEVIPGVVNAAPGATTTVDATGTLTKRTGARNWRNNNPGNLEYGPFAKAQGATGSDGRFAVFPDYKAGRKAMAEKLFKSDDYKELPLSRAIEKWAPPGENNTAAYQKKVLSVVGGQEKKMSEYTAAEQQKIMDAMQRHEGYVPGRTEKVGTVPAKRQKQVSAAQAPSAAGKAERREIEQPTPLKDQVATPLTAQLMGAEKLISALEKQAAPKKEKAALPPIKKHYDDTALTLMAYDRM